MILEEAENFLKMKIITGRLHGGHSAYIATSIGLVRWKFLMDPNATRSADMTSEEVKESLVAPNDYEIILMYANQVECTMSESHAVYYAQENCEFTVIDLETFSKQCTI